MNSFDILRKLYRNSKGAVIIANTSKSIFWTNGLDRFQLDETDIKNTQGIAIFGKPIIKLQPGEYTINIGSKSYVYDVKTFADRSNEFVVVEIKAASVSNAIIDDNNSTKLMMENNRNVHDNAVNILQIVENARNNNNSVITDEDYTSILKSTINLIKTNRNVINAIQIKEELDKELPSISISEQLVKFADDCVAMFHNTGITVNLNCVEDVFSEIGEKTLYNLCLSILNRVICLSEGRIDKITISLEMNTSLSEISISSESPSGKVRISNAKELNDKLNNGDSIGTDLFNIGYFCEKYHAEAFQRVNYDSNKALIKVKIPRCNSIGVSLFKCGEDPSRRIDRFENIALAMSDISIIED